MAAPKASGPSPPLLGPCPLWRQFPPLFPTSQSGQESTLHPPVSAHILADRFPSLSATLLWATPESSCLSLSTPLGSQGSLRMIAQGVWRRHWEKTLQIQKNSRRSWPRDGTCVLRYSLVFSSLITRFFWRFPDSLHSFLLLSIQQRFIEHLIPDTFKHGRLGDQRETIAITSWKHAFPVIGKYVPNTQLQRGQETLECIYWPSHCPSNHQIPFTKSGIAVALSVHNLLCFDFEDSVIPMGPSHSFFIISLS